MEDTVPAELAVDLVAHPERYYFDVDTDELRVGVYRGQLWPTCARTAEEGDRDADLHDSRP